MESTVPSFKLLAQTWGGRFNLQDAKWSKSKDSTHSSSLNKAAAALTAAASAKIHALSLGCKASYFAS